MSLLFFFFKQKTAYEITRSLEFRHVLFRSSRRQRRRLSLHEQHVLAGAPEPGRTAGDPDGRAVGIEPQHLEGIVLEVGAAIAARLETEAPELARDIGRHGVELRARGGTTEHRVVGDDADAALD